MHEFDKEYWEQHWQDGADGAGSMVGPPNPYLDREVSGLAPGAALDAGCGAGAEALWLASRGWEVTAADISTEALTRAAGCAAEAGLSDRVRWVEADLTSWQPERPYDLVMTHYAHPAMPQLDFYGRIASWVAPGGTLLIVGHLQSHAAGASHGHGHGHGHGDYGDGQPPAEATVTAAAVEARFDPAEWEVITAEERQRTLPGAGGGVLHDVIVRATRMIV
jgi:cyclopropane fatty-acyl-phospholipid synthase-like methyltransferase